MASTSLKRTIGSATGTTKGTFSCWVKRAGLTDGRMFSSWGSSTSQFWIIFQSDKISIADYDGSYNLQYATNRLFRDTSAWYHIVVAIDTTLGTSGDRVKLYVNGVQETSFATSTAPSQNQVLNFSNNGEEFRIGERDSGEYLDGSMTHIHFTDGYAYDATDFGETDSTSGIWKPKTAPSVTYGNNGFFLKMENSGAMGTDSSGNSNTFTVSGNLTQNVDTPSNNFATLNPLTFQFASQFASIANGNTTLTTDSGSDWGTLWSTIGVNSGKYYFEAKLVTKGVAGLIGIADINAPAQNSSSAWNLGDTGSIGYGIYPSNGYVNYSGNSDAYGVSYTDGDIMGCAMDLDNSKLYFSKNGVFMNSANPAGNTGGFSISADYTYGFALSGYASTVWSANFGQGYFGTTAVASAGTAPSAGGIFEFNCPSGYQSLSSKGINSF